MKAVHRAHLLLSLILAVAGAGPLAAKSDVAGKATEQQTDQGLVARPGLTATEVDAAVAKAAKLTKKMTPYQVEQVVGDLRVGGKSGTLDDMLKAIPRLPGIKVTATDGICRYDFTSDEKGRFFFTSWALLPGAPASH